MRRSHFQRGMLMGGGSGLVLGLVTITAWWFAGYADPHQRCDAVLTIGIFGLLPGLVGLVAAWAGICAMGSDRPAFRLRCGIAGAAAGGLSGGCVGFAMGLVWLLIYQPSYEMAGAIPISVLLFTAPAGALLGFIIGLASGRSIRPGERKTLIASGRSTNSDTW